MRLLMESWKDYLAEEETPQEKAKDAATLIQKMGFAGETSGKSFIIMVGGPGTGKGGVIATDKFMGAVIKATSGKMASKSFIKDLPPGTINQFASEVDSVLRLMQWDLAAKDYQTLSQAAQNPEQWKATVNKYSQKPQGDINLIATIASALETTPDQLATPQGGELFSKTFPNVDAYAGTKDEETRQALKGDDGHKAIKAMYMQLRSGWGEDPGAKTIKNTAVKRYNDELEAQLQKFMGGRSEEPVTEAEEENTAAAAQQVAAAGDVEGDLSQAAKDVFILDSAGEDLPTQDYAGQLQIAKKAGFETTIVWLKTGPEVSYLGNLERGVVNGERAVPPDEIAAYYDAAGGEGGGVGGTGDSIEEHFKKLLNTEYEGGALLDNLVILMNNQDKRVPPEEVKDIASDVCVNPLGDPSIEPSDHISHWLCNAERIKAITGYDVGDMPSPDPQGSPKNYNELVKAVEADFKNVLKGEEVPTLLAAQNIDVEAIKTSDNPKALAKQAADKIQDDFVNKIRDKVRGGKGDQFTSKILKSPLSEGKVYKRWSLIAGLSDMRG